VAVVFLAAPETKIADARKIAKKRETIGKTSAPIIAVGTMFLYP
jgi:hypothetical protein